MSLTFFDGFSGSIREHCQISSPPKRHVSQTASRDDKSLTFTKKQTFSLVWRRDETRQNFQRTHSRSLVKLAALCRCATQTNSSSLCAKTHSSSVQSCETTCCMLFLPSSCYIKTPNLVLLIFSEAVYMNSALFVRFYFRVEHDKELRKAFRFPLCLCFHFVTFVDVYTLELHYAMCKYLRNCRRLESLAWSRNRFLTLPKRLRQLLGSLARVYNHRYKFSVH